MKSYRIGGNLSKLLENYLQNRKQGITLNGEMSSLEYVLVGVPQGFVLRLLLFLIYRNDLPYGIA